MVAERGATLSRTTVAPAPSRVTAWRGNDRGTGRDQYVQGRQGGVNEKL
jgi:hypothetical protein